MAWLGLSISPGFLLLTAFLFYAGGYVAVTAFGTAALAHELGHLIAMLLVGADVRAVRLTASGPVIDFSGDITPRQELGIVAAGPVAGIVFAVLCLLFGSPYFQYAGLIAMLAGVFNLLPVLPLDGGRLALALLRTAMPERIALLLMRIAGTLCGVGVAATGCMLGSFPAAAVGVWMTVLANHPELR